MIVGEVTMPGNITPNIGLARDDVSMAKNFEFALISEWKGYNSANDKTNVVENVMVQGSFNIYKKLSGNLAVRPGQLRIGAADATFSPVSSEFVWYTSWGATYPVWITNGVLQVYINNIWYTLATVVKTRYVFDKWYNTSTAKDILLFVCGDSNIYSWTGGNSTIVSTSNSAGIVSTLAAAPTNGGSGYSVGDILTITTGGTGATATVLTLTGQVIQSVNLHNAGLGYAVNDVLQIAGVLNNGIPATVVVTSIGAGGAVTGISLQTTGGSYAASQTNIATIETNGVGVNASVDITLTNTAIGTVVLTTGGSGYSTGTGKSTSGGTGTSATLHITAVATGSITLAGDATQAGFSPTGSVNINANQYAYAGVTGKVLTGITPNNVIIEPNGSVVLQSITTTTGTPVASGFNNDFIKVINNQVYVGSYTSRDCYISSNADFTDYTVPDPTIDGSPEFLTLDSTLNGIAVKSGNAVLSVGKDKWVTITFSDVTIGTTVDNTPITVRQTNVSVSPVANQAAAYAHEFISTSGDNIIYLSQDQQLRMFGNVNDLFYQAYPTLSQEVYTELAAQDFVGGGLKCIGDFTYITAPNSGITYLYQVRQYVTNGDVVAVERLWHAPFIWNATRIDEINGTVVAFSNANPQLYQVWDTNQWHDDSPADEPLPYNCVLALPYLSGNRRQGLQFFDKVYSEGYLTPGTPLNLTVNYDYQGATAQIMAIVNSVAQPAYLFQQTQASLGDNSLGDKPLGQGIVDESESADLQDLAKFKAITSLTQVNCFEYQLILSSDTADAQWEILAEGTNAKLVPNVAATYIINNPA